VSPPAEGPYTVTRRAEGEALVKVRRETVRIDLDKHTSAAIRDLAAVIEAAREVIPLFDNDTAWWRGHGNADWPLHPQVFRRDPEHPESRLYKEAALIGHFVSRAPTRSHRLCPTVDDYFGWLFLAQHYGLPTRLLDWSENPLIAVYFAVSEHPDDDGCLWALWPGGINLECRGATGLVTIRDPKVAEIAKAAFYEDSRPGEVILAIDGQEIDPRMLAQMSRFTVHSYHTPLEIVPEIDRWLRRFLIPKEHKQKIRQQLSAMGIRESNIFPDLAHLAAELKRSRFG
jgi:FRG domain